MIKSLLFCIFVVLLFPLSTQADGVNWVYGDMVALHCYKITGKPGWYMCKAAHLDEEEDVTDPDTDPVPEPDPEPTPVSLFYTVCAECHPKKTDWANKTNANLVEWYKEKSSKAKGKHNMDLNY